jgi:Ca-activated chloride channel homolog
MNFLWPRLLYLLAIVPLLVAAYIAILRRRSRSALGYSAMGLVREALGAGPGFRRHVPAILMLAGLTVSIVALARPAADVTLPSDQGTIILAMDISGSMRARDIKPSRIQASETAARAFIKEQPPGVRIGIVAFAGTATLVQPPTRNRDALFAAIGRLQLQRATAVGNGILASLAAIFEHSNLDLGPIDANRALPLDPNAPPPAPLPAPVEPGSLASAAIILLTDGQTNTGADPIEAARRAADLGVRIFTVGLGTTAGQIVGFGGWSMRAQLDEASLKTIADITRGKYYKADNDSNLKEVYHQLGSRLSLEKQRTEISALFAGLAGALALISGLLSLLWYRRIA